MKMLSSFASHRWVLVSLACLTVCLTVCLTGCVHSGANSSRAADSGVQAQTQAAETPWLQLAELKRISFGVTDQSQVTGDASHLFWTRTENQASTIVHQRLIPTDDDIDSVRLNPIFPAQFDTLDPAWNSQQGMLAFVSFESSARGKICVWRLPAEAVRKSEVNTADASADCFDHPGRVSQPVWGPEGRVFFLMSALPWEDSSNDSIWVLDPASRLSRKVTDYARIAAFDINPASGDIVAIGWRKEGVGDRGQRSRASLLLVPARSPNSFRDPQTGYLPAIPFAVDAAGMPASPRFDPDGRKLYWSQFIADSNEDARVDADDRSVVVAADFSAIREQVLAPAAGEGAQLGQARKNDLAEVKTNIVPVQLTAAAGNCMYPRVIGERLYVTCAPEAPVVRRDPGLKSNLESPTSQQDFRQLDIFSLPKHGQVPESWSEDVLMQVRQQARDPSIQLLLTNVLRARLQRNGLAGASDSQIQNRATDRQSALLLDLVGLHMRAQQSRAASEMLDIWNARYGQNWRSEPAVAVELLLDILKLRKTYAGNEISAPYREAIEALQLRAKSYSQSRGQIDHDFASGLVTLYLESSMGSRVSSQVGRDAETAEELFSRPRDEQPLTKPLPKPAEISKSETSWTLSSFDDLLVLFASQWIDTELEQRRLDRNRAVRLYVRLADSSYADSRQASLSFAVRAMELARESKESQSGLGSLSFKAPVLEDLRITQVEALALVNSAVGSGREVDEASRARFRDLNDRIEKSLKTYGKLSYRAQASIVGGTLAEAEQTLLFGYHVTNWLSKTPIESYDYGVLLEFYRTVTFRRAYAAWDKKDYRGAADIFYTAIRLTRDEEAHLGFILCALASGQSSNQIMERYASTSSALGPRLSGIPLLHGVSALVEYEKLVRQNGEGRQKFLDQALAALEEPQDSVPIVRDFIRGYVAHERFRASLGGDIQPWWQRWWQQDTPAGDLRARDESIYYISNALDRALRRGHVRSALRAQLAKSHLLAGNSALSADLLATALSDLGDGASERPEWTLVLARALARSGRPGKALAALDRLATLPIGQTERAKSAPMPDWPWWNGILSFYAAESGDFQRACDLSGKGEASFKRLVAAQAAQAEAGRFVALGELEHQAWSCLKTGKPEDRLTAYNMFTRIVQEAGNGGAQGRRMRNDFLDSSPAQLRARAAGFLAQVEELPERRVNWHSERENALKSVIASNSKTALPARTMQIYLAKSCSERAMELLKSRSESQFVEAATCATRALEAITKDAGANLEAEDVTGEAVGLTPSLDDFQALRHATLVALAGSRYGFDKGEISGGIRTLVKVFDSSFGSLGRQESTFGSWGADLLQLYLQTGITIELARSLQTAARERRTVLARESLSASDWKTVWQKVAESQNSQPAGVCSLDESSPVLRKLLTGRALSDFSQSPKAAVLVTWCRSLVASFGS
jgi:hypothetical protein